MRIIEHLINKIFNEDCLEGMKRIESDSVDLVLIDPPYGINFFSNWSKNEDYRKKKSTVKGIKNDKDNILFLDDVARELFRVLKKDTHMYWFTRWDKVEEQKPMLEKVGFKVKNNLIWAKNNWSMGDLKGSYAGQYECILFCQKGRKELNVVDGKSRHSDIIHCDRVSPNNSVHSHQKPIELLEFLIKKSTNENDVVLDCFMGSGSTALASINTKRNFVGFELEKEYYDICIERINNHLSEGR